MLSQKIHTSPQSRSLEHIVMQDFGVSGHELMRRAGQGAFAIFQEFWPDCKRVAVLCGSGNNGGDGYVFATEARKFGIEVDVYRKSEPKSPEAIQAAREYADQGGLFSPLNGDWDLGDYDAVVDALVGIGLSNQLNLEMTLIVDKINASAARVMSLDIPSGVNSDNGNVPGCAVRADVTVTFISLKLGLLTAPGSEYTGSLKLEKIGVPESAYSQVGHAALRVHPAELATNLPIRRDSAHKGTSGRVLIVGGSETMQGAAVMAAQAAYRTGTGLVSIAARTAESSAILAHGTPEIRVFDISDANEIEDLMNTYDIIGIGPGLGQSDWAQKIWEIVANSSGTLVVDADALNLLARQPRKRENWILTPHPGEAGRLLEEPASKVQDDRLDATLRIVERYGGVCVLKGAGSLIASEDETWLCDRGNPGMATAGMGDILTGVICGLLAQGVEVEAAARIGVWLHATAGDDSAAHDGMIGMMATDLLPGIRTNLNSLLNGTAS